MHRGPAQVRDNPADFSANQQAATTPSAMSLNSNLSQKICTLSQMWPCSALSHTSTGCLSHRNGGGEASGIAHGQLDTSKASHLVRVEPPIQGFVPSTPQPCFLDPALPQPEQGESSPPHPHHRRCLSEACVSPVGGISNIWASVNAGDQLSRANWMGGC